MSTNIFKKEVNRTMLYDLENLGYTLTHDKTFCLCGEKKTSITIFDSDIYVGQIIRCETCYNKTKRQHNIISTP